MTVPGNPTEEAVDKMLAGEFNPPADPPAGDPPGGDPPPPSPPPPPPDPENPLLKTPAAPGVFQVSSEMLGIELSSPDQLKEIINQHKALKASETAWLQEKEALATELKTLKGVNPYGDDPDMFRLAKIKKDSPEEFAMYSKVVLGEPSPIELLKMDFIKRHPEYKDDPETVDMFITKDPRYSQLFDPEADKDSFEYKSAKLQFDEVVKGVKDSLLSKFNSIEVPAPPKPEELEASQEEVIKTITEAWMPKFKEIHDGFSKVSIPIPDPSDATKLVNLMDYELPAEEKAAIAREAADFIISTRMPLTDENRTLVSQMMIDRAFLRNLPKIIAHVLDTVNESNNSQWREFVNNPSRKQTPGNGNPIPKTKMDAVISQIEKDFPI